PASAPLSLHDALPISVDGHQAEGEQRRHRGQEDEVKVAPQLPVHLRDNAAPFPDEFRAPPPGWTSGGGPPAGQAPPPGQSFGARSEEHTSELQSRENL